MRAALPTRSAVADTAAAPSTAPRAPAFTSSAAIRAASAVGVAIRRVAWTGTAKALWRATAGSPVSKRSSMSHLRGLAARGREQNTP